MTSDTEGFRAPDAIFLHARFKPNKRALVDLPTGREWSYGALDDAIQRCIAVLAGHGVGAGARVAVLGKNSADQCILHLALARMGAIYVPLNWRLAPAELKVLIEDCDPALLIHDDDNAPAAEQLSPPRLAVTDLAAAVEAAEPAARAPMPAENIPSVLLYTSGTSGKPKGVIITEANLYHSACNLGLLARITHQSVFVCEGPLFHVIGLSTSFRSPLTHGATVLVSGGFDPGMTLKRLADPALGISHYFCVPQMAMSLRNHPDFSPETFKGLTALFTGGAPNPAADIQWWLDRGIPMVDGFGMTETGTTMGMSIEPDVIRAKAGSVGLPAPTIELRIADEDGHAVEAGVVGEMWVRGPNVTPGYWNRPEETGMALTPDGWFKTGDLGRRDAEGFVSIVDRKKDMYISGGENVYPGEVERVLLLHPAIADASVVGRPDQRWGEVGWAYLVPRGDARPSPEELAKYCGDNLARYKIPKAFVWLDALPRTASGKIQKHVLRARDEA